MWQAKLSPGGNYLPMFRLQSIFDKTLAMNTTPSLIAKSLENNSRRRFMRYFTAGATAIAVQGCGGGSAGSALAGSPAAPTVPATPAAPVVVAPVTPGAPVVPSAPVVAPAAPTILAIPDIAFVEGTPSSFSVAAYISADNVAAFTLSLNAQPLPAGVTFNAATRSFDYDGKGAPAGTDGHVLTATGA
jgi:hypothetical protein